ncbi:ABC transporter permease [Candidatus Formimonas warabiya]|uniref:Peptide ABC transporter permease n=1 Tax=Formimonas warabiya TaxID=1761012 RepID=A0A3G1KQC5_FORW1|nr:ABC transporter permease [Candidatus Formimonas warabiya]ATW24646.1 peptide ABC transporter permease [Candidatus Formimonas warabiya]
MKSYIVKRLFLSVFVLFGVILTTFVLTRIVPSNPAAQWVGPKATPEQVKAAVIELGLDKPVYIQFEKYLANLLQGNMGRSLRTHQPVTTELKSYLPATLELVILSTLIATFLGIPLGLISAKRKDSWIDHFSRFFSVGAVSLPTFWVALFLQLIFYRSLEILPLGGQLSTKLTILYQVPHITGFLLFDCLITGNFFLLKDALLHMILPAVTIGLYPLGLVARMTRSALVEILSEDYIKATRSYGLSEKIVLWKYALKNSLGATATVVALSIGYTLVNTFLVEAIFSWPGIGNYIATAVVSLDYPAILGVTIFSACAYVVLNLIADIIIALDPRVRV